MDDIFRATLPYIITPLNIAIQFGLGIMFWLNLVSVYLVKIYIKYTEKK